MSTTIRATRYIALDLVGLKRFLGDQLGSTVGGTTRDGPYPRLRDRIEQTAIRIF